MTCHILSAQNCTLEHPANFLTRRTRVKRVVGYNIGTRTEECFAVHVKVPLIARRDPPLFDVLFRVWRLHQRDRSEPCLRLEGNAWRRRRGGEVYGCGDVVEFGCAEVEWVPSFGNTFWDCESRLQLGRTTSIRRDGRYGDVR